MRDDWEGQRELSRNRKKSREIKRYLKHGDEEEENTPHW